MASFLSDEYVRVQARFGVGATSEEEGVGRRQSAICQKDQESQQNKSENVRICFRVRASSLAILGDGTLNNAD